MKYLTLNNFGPLVFLLLGILNIFGTNINALAEVVQKETNPIVISVKRDTSYYING